MNKKESNIFWYKSSVTRELRNEQNKHKSVNLWFTGLSASGKSTIAHAVEKKLFKMGCRTFVFDGDNVRHGLCFDLGFSINDRSENIRRISEMVKLFLDAGIIALTAFISPLKKDREIVRNLLGEENFIEIYCHCPVEICETRDGKGIYKRAKNGEIKNFTGISSPYEAPEAPDLKLSTSTQSIEDCVNIVIDFLKNKGVFLGS